MTPDQIIAHLCLEPHPEGGCFRETFRDSPNTDGRPASTCIYYLLRAGERSRWHTVDAAEIWHYYAGDPLRLFIETAGQAVEEIALGPDLAKGERPQAVVPPGRWQAAEPAGAWTLVGCTVAPGFSFEHFHLATKQEEDRLLARLKASA